MGCETEAENESELYPHTLIVSTGDQRQNNTSPPQGDRVQKSKHSEEDSDISKF